MTLPNIKSIAQGQVAGKLAYEVIERVPKISLEAAGSYKIKE